MLKSHFNRNLDNFRRFLNVLCESDTGWHVEKPNPLRRRPLRSLSIKEVEIRADGKKVGQVWRIFAAQQMRGAVRRAG
ncbi:MAG: hypothetical protein HQL54_00340 [Magnetococcales bacterium]|nr:hypothetical protein [Magnetococcales bacterium]